jgi:hypothetical protein
VDAEPGLRQTGEAITMCAFRVFSTSTAPLLTAYLPYGASLGIAWIVSAFVPALT